MLSSLEKICTEALALPKESQEILVEKLVENLETNVDPDIERIHLDEVKTRRDEIKSGKVDAVPGNEALKMVREMVKK